MTQLWQAAVVVVSRGCHFASLIFNVFVIFLGVDAVHLEEVLMPELLPMLLLDLLWGSLCASSLDEPCVGHLQVLVVVLVVDDRLVRHEFQLCLYYTLLFLRVSVCLHLREASHRLSTCSKLRLARILPSIHPILDLDACA